MNDYGIKEYVRLMSSVSISQTDKNRIAENLLKENLTKKDIQRKYVAAASVFAVLTVGAVIVLRGMKQDINIM